MFRPIFLLRHDTADSEYGGMPTSGYAGRREILKRLGFISYAEYLRSDLWARVREQAFTTNGRACVRCGRKATSVHHADYREATLTGEDVSGLMPSCGRCHELAEFGPGGEKRTLEEATAFLRIPWRSNRGPKPGTPISEAAREARAKKTEALASLKLVHKTMRAFRYIINPNLALRYERSLERLHAS